MKFRTLKDLAQAINGLDNGYRAIVTPSHSSTDRKPRGFRYITHKGKGRKGQRIKVYAPDNTCVINHDTSETYRTVSEAVEQAERLFGDAFRTAAKCKHKFPRPPTHERVDANGSVKVYFCEHCLTVKVIQRRAQDWTYKGKAVETLVE